MPRTGVGRAMRNTLKYIATIAVLAIGLTACGLAEASAPETTEPGIAVGEPTPGTGNPSTGMCLPDAPHCEDAVIEPVTYAPIQVEGDQPGEGSVIGTGELVGTDGNTVTVGFWMGTDACFAVERVDVAETDTKVAVDITIGARALDQTCIEIAEARSITVELAEPLGGRILEIGGAPVNG